MTDPFEKKLQDAMRREPAPEWLEGAIMARIRQEQQARKPSAWLSGAWLRWAGAVATLAVVVGGFQFERARQERMAGEQAKQQMLMALRVTGSKLRMAQERVYERVNANQ